VPESVERRAGQQVGHVHDRSAPGHQHARELAGEADGDRAELRVAIAGIRVEGVVKRGKVDAGILSSGDREAIERQIREDVLRGGTLTATGMREGARARIALEAPTGRAELTCAVDVRTEADATVARGEADVSLRALGVSPVKGPMGAFRVADRVKVRFDLVFVA